MTIDPGQRLRCPGEVHLAITSLIQVFQARCTSLADGGGLKGAAQIPMGAGTLSLCRRLRMRASSDLSAALNWARSV